MHNDNIVISFRPAILQDVIALNTLVNSAYRGDSSKIGWTTEADLLDGQRVDPDSLQEMISSKNNTILLCLNNNTVIGCVFLQNKAESAYLGMLTVKPDMQAAGLGRQILAFAEQWIKNTWGHTLIEMTVIQKRTELLAWYQRRGYLPTAETQPFPYHDQRFGVPKLNDLEFIVLKKTLCENS